MPHAGALFAWIHEQLREEQGKAVVAEDSERIQGSIELGSVATGVGLEHADLLVDAFLAALP